MKVVKAEPRHATEVLGMVNECVKDMNMNGIYQWTDQYPKADTFISDIESGTLFAIEENDGIIGIIVLSEHQDRQYEEVDWKDKAGKVLVIHRLAVHPRWQRKGVAGRLLDFAEDYARENMYTSIRVDTYSGNPRSMKLFEKWNYDKKAGYVHFPECKEHFYCYEKLIR